MNLNIKQSVLFIFGAMLVISGVILAGSLTPSSTPAPTMYTLNNIYEKITTGAASSEADHALSTSSAPGSSMKTLKQIFEAIPPVLSLSNSTTTIPVGINLSTTTLSAIDADLVSENIKSGIDIFGIAGSASSDPGYYGLGTGQTLCYTNDASSGQACGVTDFPSQDASIYGSSFVRSFVDNGATVSDASTGLMWQKADSTSVAACFSWQNALLYCDSFNAGGSRDGQLGPNTGWRLPTVIEVMNIFNFGDGNYYSIFGTGTFYYWSSTTRAAQSTEAYYMTRTSATIVGISTANKANCSGRARCVRFEN